jgi:hypothetical protein
VCHTCTNTVRTASSAYVSHLAPSRRRPASSRLTPLVTSRACWWSQLQYGAVGRQLQSRADHGGGGGEARRAGGRSGKVSPARPASGVALGGLPELGLGTCMGDVMAYANVQDKQHPAGCAHEAVTCMLHGTYMGVPVGPTWVELLQPMIGRGSSRRGERIEARWTDMGKAPRASTSTGHCRRAQHCTATGGQECTSWPRYLAGCGSGEVRGALVPVSWPADTGDRARSADRHGPRPCMS